MVVEKNQEYVAVLQVNNEEILTFSKAWAKSLQVPVPVSAGFIRWAKKDEYES